MSLPSLSLMADETAEAPRAVARALRENTSQLKAVAKLLDEINPSHILTCARGSSDHAASYFKYLSEIVMGVPCCSIGASVASVYEAKLKLRDTVLLTISQSGRSPDILAMQSFAKASGTPTIAITNDPKSPLAMQTDFCLSLHAGPEHSVAATKTFISSAALAASIVALGSGNHQLKTALDALPDALELSLEFRDQEFEQVLANATSAFVIGRGPSMAVAFEAALKLKETCGIHAEGYSAAELLHGPMEIVDRAFPVIVFGGSGAAAQRIEETASKLSAAGAKVVSQNYSPTLHEHLDPLAMIQNFYLSIERVSRARGRNPDKPRLLSKVTSTI